MSWMCKVLQSGDDIVVELPDEWVARYGVKIGDELRISYPADGEITYSVIDKGERGGTCETESAKERLLSRIMLAEEEIANGDSLDFDEFSASVARECGL